MAEVKHTAALVKLATEAADLLNDWVLPVRKPDAANTYAFIARLRAAIVKAGG